MEESRNGKSFCFFRFVATSATSEPSDGVFCCLVCRRPQADANTANLLTGISGYCVCLPACYWGSDGNVLSVCLWLTPVSTELCLWWKPEGASRQVRKPADEVMCNLKIVFFLEVMDVILWESFTFSLSSWVKSMLNLDQYGIPVGPAPMLSYLLFWIRSCLLDADSTFELGLPKPLPPLSVLHVQGCAVVYNITSIKICFSKQIRSNVKCL